MAPTEEFKRFSSIPHNSNLFQSEITENKSDNKLSGISPTKLANSASHIYPDQNSSNTNSENVRVSGFPGQQERKRSPIKRMVDKMFGRGSPTKKRVGTASTETFTFDNQAAKNQAPTMQNVKLGNFNVKSDYINTEAGKRQSPTARSMPVFPGMFSSSEMQKIQSYGDNKQTTQ